MVSTHREPYNDFQRSNVLGTVDINFILDISDRDRLSTQSPSFSKEEWRWLANRCNQEESWTMTYTQSSKKSETWLILPKETRSSVKIQAA